MNLDSTVFACDDPDVIAGYVAHAQLERDILNACVEEAKERWQRLPMVQRGTTRTTVLGLAVRPHDWSWEAARDRYRASQPEDRTLWGFDADRHDPVVIPEGWRKRVKDDYLSPPLKGSSEAILEARAFLRKYSCESVRGYLERVHGAPHVHFAGMRLITIGADVKEDRLWIIAGQGYEVKDERFVQVPLSEYVAMRERNPRPETDEEV